MSIIYPRQHQQFLEYCHRYSAGHRTWADVVKEIKGLEALAKQTKRFIPVIQRRDHAFASRRYPKDCGPKGAERGPRPLKPEGYDKNYALYLSNARLRKRLNVLYTMIAVSRGKQHIKWRENGETAVGVKARFEHDDFIRTPLGPSHYPWRVNHTWRDDRLMLQPLVPKIQINGARFTWGRDARKMVR